MASSKRSAPTSDEVRRNILQWFYDLNRKGGAPKGMRDLCSGIRGEYGYKQQLVKEHLSYLCDLEYIKKDSVMTKVRTGSTERDQARISYRIGAKGIEYIEGKSAFSDRDRYPGINVTATGASIVVLGDGNVVNSPYRPLYDELGKFLSVVADSTGLNDTSKLEASVNIETIRDQLALDRPNRTIVEAAWEAASRICTTATLAEYCVRLSAMITALFS